MRNKIFLVLFIVPFFSKGQEIVETDRSPYKNTLKWNLTPIAIGGFKNIVFSYERLLPRNNSFSISSGFLSFPEFGSNSSGIFRNIERTKSTGFTFSGDYRFYLNRNKFAAPDGIYWGPFFNFYNYNTDFKADYYESGVYQASGEMETNINVAFVGVQLGYQFVFKERYTVDLILFGPALGMYNASFKASGDIVPQEELQEIIDFLKERYPVVRDLINTGSTDGAGTSWGAGFRYAIKIGYRF